MATRQLLVELVQRFSKLSGHDVTVEAVGGVDAARRVKAGEPFDVAFLAADALAMLEAEGHVVAGSVVALANSPVAVAVPAGATVPEVASEAALRQSVLAAPSIGYSTGPSGAALLRLFQRWGIADEVAPRLVQAPPGVPVGALLARGDVVLGFQQLSELMNTQGIALAGTLPEPVQIITTFSGAVCAASIQPQAARELLTWLASPEADEAKQRHGMQPA